jgi:hypothetical protein
LVLRVFVDRTIYIAGDIASPLSHKQRNENDNWDGDTQKK